MNRFWDTLLQVVFILCILGIVVFMYLTRIAQIDAIDPGTNLDSYNFAHMNAYELHLHEDRLIQEIELAKIEYAGAVDEYKMEVKELTKIDSVTERREKENQLNEIFSSEFFDSKVEKINNKENELERLRSVICDQYCQYQDLQSAN